MPKNRRKTPKTTRVVRTTQRVIAVSRPAPKRESWAFDAALESAPLTRLNSDTPTVRYVRAVEGR